MDVGAAVTAADAGEGGYGVPVAVAVTETGRGGERGSRNTQQDSSSVFLGLIL